jgi:hypothetical protein
MNLREILLRYMAAGGVHCFFATKRQRNAGKRFVVRADEKLTAFVEVESAIRSRRELP